MPAAMVDFCSPAAPSSSPFEPNYFHSPNPSIGEASDRRPPSFPTADPLPGFLDRSNVRLGDPDSKGLKDAGFGERFASQSPPVTFPPIHSDAVPKKSARLSKPRFAKLRKHLPSARVRPAVNADTDDRSGSNPFRCRPVGVEADASGRNPEAKEIRAECKPFEHAAGLNASNNSNTGSFDSSKTGRADFSMNDNEGVFAIGSSVKNGSKSLRRTSKKLSKSNNTRQQSNKSMKNVRSADAVEETLSFPSVSSRNPGAGFFIFTSGVTDNPISEHGLPENLNGRTKGNSTSTTSGSSGFVFGATSVVNLGTENTKSSCKPDHKAHSEAFIFESCSKQSSKSDKNSLKNSNGPSCSSSQFGKYETAAFVFGATSVLPSGAEVKNLNIQSSINKDDSDKIKHSYDRTTSGVSNSFVFGCNADAQSCYTGAPTQALPESKLDTEKETISVCMSNEGHGDPAGGFSFGSSLKKTTVKMPASDVNLQKLNTEGTKNANPSTRIIDSGYPCKSDVTNGFSGVNPGCNCEASSCFLDTSVHAINEDMNHLNISNEKENSDHAVQRTINSSIDLDTDIKFAFQTGKCSDVGIEGVGRCKTDNRTRLRPKPATSSSSDNVSQPVAAGFTFAGTSEELKSPDTGFMSPIPDAPGLSKESLFTGLDQNTSLKKKGDYRSTRRKKRDMFRQSIPVHQNSTKIFSSLEKISGSPLGYSPMDYSPYNENLVAYENLTEIPRTADSHCSFPSDNVDTSSVCVSARLEAEIPTCSVEAAEPQDSQSENVFILNSSLNGISSCDFNFGASFPTQGSASVSRHQRRRKPMLKGLKNLKILTPNANISSTHPEGIMFPGASSLHPVSAKDLNVPQGGDDNRTETQGKQVERINSSPSTAATVAADEACNQWRQRGNQAYSRGDMSGAEECYTRGLDSFSDEISRSGNRALMLCYSNRAAARMALGRMQEALSDCLMAVEIDPSFLKAQLRAGNCHLAFGETEEALENFKNCLSKASHSNSDHKIFLEASDGLLKTQQAADYMVQSEELVLKRSHNEATKALQLVSEALLLCPYSDKLMERKAEALLLLQRYNEVIHFCEQSTEIAERNCGVNMENCEDMQSLLARLWRCRLMSKSLFYLGRFDEALGFLKKHELFKSKLDKNLSDSSESLASLVNIISELLHHKASGNEAFRIGKHRDAVNHYSAALTCNTESRPFAAICFCNRAAAHQALGQITDAVADCSIAIALDSSYLKAISRRVTLHEMIRDYEQAANDLRRQIAVMEKQLKNEETEIGFSIRVGCNSDLKRAHARLGSFEEEAKKMTPLDFYQILGVELSCSLADIKKAYRKAALKHHPDKASQFFAKSESSEDNVWREVSEEVHKDADRLFKMIAEAYSVLSDPIKRLDYDAEEETRSALRKGHGVRNTTRTDVKFGRSSSRERWRTYGNSHQGW